jgi:Uma2 family endonuclease
MTAELQRHLFTVDDFQRMVKAGILDSHARVELIEGEIVDMPPIGPAHGDVVDFLTDTLVATAAELGYLVRVQGSVQINDISQPQPDFALLRRRDRAYRRKLPDSGDILLMIEVSDSSASYDRRIKAPLYARNGVPELWIVNVRSETIEVFRDPSESGYTFTQIARRGDTIIPQALPSLSFSVDEILGPDDGGA